MKKIFLCVLVVMVLAPMVSDSFALQEVAGKINLNLKPGQVQHFNWELVSDSNNSTSVSLSAKGSGSEMLSFPKTVLLQPHQTLTIPVTVTVPSDYSGKSVLTPFLFATQYGEKQGPTVLNIQVMKIINLNINGTQSIQPNSAPAQKSAVPEFPLAIPVLVISLVFLITASRMKFFTSKI